MRRTLALAIAALVVGGACIWAASAHAPKKSAPDTQRVERDRPVLALTGLTFTDSCDAASSVLSVDALEVRDRKVGMFSMRGIEEVEMHGVRGRLASCAKHGAEGCAGARIAALRRVARVAGAGSLAGLRLARFG